MSSALIEGVRLLRSGLASEEFEIEVTLRLPRESAEKVLALLNAEQSVGAVVIPTKQEFTTTEAAKILGMSRPTLMKMIESGRIEFRMVGTHHRIPAPAIRALHEHLDEDHPAVVAEISDRHEATQPLSGPVGRRVAERRDALLDILHRHGITHPEVFGSAARGDDREGSDLDLLVDLAPGTDLFDLVGIKTESEEALGAPVDLIPRDGLKERVRAAAANDLVPL